MGGTMRILVIEDDTETAAYILRGLHEHGHVADHVADGQDGLVMAAGGGHDVLVVDRMLPGIDGLGLVRTLRAAGVKAPVLFLTEPRRVCRRLQLLRRWSHDDESNNEQVFARGARARGADGAGAHR